ncbi:T9SS type A sorting domain-containing protein [Crocinitomicaceae bacterium]|nr:T9SS type A sorting domain-containing protein [Crocinitomicaceae bacterium]
MKKMLLFFAVVSTLASSASAQYYDQTAGITTSGVISAYMTDNDTLVQSADDFTVPAGPDWDVTSVTVHGFRNGLGANMTDMQVQIWTDAGGPSTPVYNALHVLPGAGVPSPNADTTITITIPSTTLIPGTYWLSVYGFTEAASRWNWTTHGAVQIGATAMLQDADDYFGAGATSWTAVTTLGLTDPDFTFQINENNGNIGISDIFNEVSIYPNPASDVLNVVVDAEESKVTIYNVTGNVVLNEVNPSTQINIAHLSAGAYVVEVSTINGVSRIQIIKK